MINEIKASQHDVSVYMKTLLNKSTRYYYESALKSND